VARALAATDPDRAERVAQSITNEESKAGVLGDIAGKLAAIDPGSAARLGADAERAAHSLALKSSEGATDVAREQTYKVWSLIGIADMLAALDPDRAARLVADAERLARSITDMPLKIRALVTIAEA